MTLNERKLKILQAIVMDFIRSAEPIGSRTLSRKYGMGISPATIRNEMADLEEMGFLTHPYTSAGRVPSTKAYRLYVDDLMEKYELPEKEKIQISSKLDIKISELNRTVEHAAKLLSDITNLTSFAVTLGQDEDYLKYVNIIPVDENTVVLVLVSESGKASNTVLKPKVPYGRDQLELLSKVLTYNYKGKRLSDILTMDIIRNFESDIEVMSKLAETIMPNFMRTLEDMLDTELYLDGLMNIFSIPEYSDIEKAKMFLEMVNQENFTDILVNRENGVIITIGDENTEEIMKDCSLITATYRINGRLVGRLGVIGPTRMRYNQVTSVIEYMTEHLSEAFVTGGEEDDEE
ncbi:MAG TPA: heat-inducible transcriptional repressor HrcA [Anaerovoracaceae bacterium]|nr:heat-inducible transcriptional repressor HrcA [Anaerovoracaceae bacterium]